MRTHNKIPRLNTMHPTRTESSVSMEMVRTTIQNLIKVTTFQQHKSFSDFKEQLIFIFGLGLCSVHLM